MQKILLFFFININVLGQNTVYDAASDTKAVFGVSARVVLDIGLNNKSSFRFGVSTGFGYSIYSSNLTSVNLEYSYLWSGLGTYNDENCSYIVISPIVTQSFNSKRQELREDNYRYQSLYYFTDLIPPALQNPYLNSSSIGLNFVRFYNQRIYSKWQRIGHIGFKFNTFHIAYNNDGGPVLNLIADGEDRYFTGIGIVNVHLNDKLVVNKFNISFYKFTGYSKMSFEISDELLYSSVDYDNPNQNFFNKGFWEFGVGNSEYGSVFLRINNPKNTKEVQNFIHYHMGFGYHQNLDDIQTSIGISPSLIQSFINLR